MFQGFPRAPEVGIFVLMHVVEAEEKFVEDTKFSSIARFELIETTLLVYGFLETRVDRSSGEHGRIGG
jgi:hypothetical protein